MELRRILKLTLKTTLILVCLVAAYAIAAFSLPYISVNSGFKPCEKGAVKMYILTNGVHTDLVVPVKNDIKDWTATVSPAATKSGTTDPKYAAFGWGDKGFYLETPTWGDLKLKTAFTALFYLGSSAMHVSFYDTLSEDATCRQICISADSYKKLTEYIESSFEKNENGTRLIRGASYGYNDLFYDAKGKYSLFYTCNTWANNGLKAANLKACLWTPFDKGIFYQYK